MFLKLYCAHKSPGCIKMRFDESEPGSEALCVTSSRWHQCHALTDHTLGSHAQKGQASAQDSVGAKQMLAMVTRLTLKSIQTFQTTWSFTGKILISRKKHILTCLLKFHNPQAPSFYRSYESLAEQRLQRLCLPQSSKNISL